MDTRQPYRGVNEKPRYKAHLKLECETHRGGHHVRLYSGIAADAWWTADMLRRTLEDLGYPCAVIFYRRLTDELWEIVPESVALGSYPQDAS